MASFSPSSVTNFLVIFVVLCSIHLQMVNTLSMKFLAEYKPSVHSRQPRDADVQHEYAMGTPHIGAIQSTNETENSSNSDQMNKESSTADSDASKSTPNHDNKKNEHMSVSSSESESEESRRKSRRKSRRRNRNRDRESKENSSWRVRKTQGRSMYEDNNNQMQPSVNQYHNDVEVNNYGSRRSKNKPVFGVGMLGLLPVPIAYVPAG